MAKWKKETVLEDVKLYIIIVVIYYYLEKENYKVSIFQICCLNLL